MNSLLVLLSLAGVALSAQTPTVSKHIVMTKEEITIESPGYPEPAKNIDVHIWLLKSYFGAKITVTCDDIKVTESPGCSESYFMIRNGAKAEKHCGNKSKITAENAQGFTVLVLDVKGGSGAFKCRAKLEEAHPSSPVIEKEINLEENELKLLEVNSCKNPVETWLIKSKPNTKITITCSHIEMRDTSGKMDPKCTFNYAEFGLGSEIKTECGQNGKVIYTSSSNRLPIRFFSKTEYYIRHVKCLATATVGQYRMDTPSEEVDSREYGAKAGKKATNCNCGRANKQGTTGRILHGQDAAANEFPWIVALTTLLMGNFFCGGTIISRYHVLSAAHCFTGKTARSIAILAGGSDISFGNKNIAGYGVEKIITHEKYDTSLHYNDISILLTEVPIKFSETVGPACLPQTKPNLIGQYLTAAGWGAVSAEEQKKPGFVLYKDLKKTHLRVVERTECAGLWNPYLNIENDSQQCAWSNHTATCHGDSGSPMTWVDPETNRYVLVGVASLGGPCELFRPNVNTDVFYFKDWIDKTVAENAHADEQFCHKID